MKKFKRLLRSMFLLKNVYVVEPFVYLDSKGNVMKEGVSDRVEWLGEHTSRSTSRRKAENQVIKAIENDFPAYKDALWLL